MSNDTVTTPLMFSDMSRARQLWESIGGAFLTGAIAGVLLGYVWWGYVLAVLVAVIGGLGAGAQHRSLLGALARGAVGGAVWAAAILLALAATSRAPTVELPEPRIGFLLWGIVPACAVGAISYSMARRRRGRA
jgi:hypothetical protein